MMHESSTNFIILEWVTRWFSFSWTLENTRHEIQETLICRSQSKNLQHFYNFENLKNTKRVRFFLSDEQVNDIHEIHIDDSLKKWIVRFLQETNISWMEELDCFWFCKYILWITSIEKDTHEIDENHLKSWDIIFLENDTIGGHHFAVYLWNGNYISRLWYAWVVVFTTLQQLKTSYLPTNILYFRKNQNS